MIFIFYVPTYLGSLILAGKATRVGPCRQISLAGLRFHKAVFVKDVITVFTCESNMKSSLPFNQ